MIASPSACPTTGNVRGLVTSVIVPQAAIVSVSAVVLWVTQRGWCAGYDEYWHIMVAELEPFRLFLADLRRLPHPPLTLLLTRWLTEPGRDPVHARLLPMTCGLATIPVMYVLGRRAGLSSPLAHLGSFILGTSHAFVSMSLCVRVYAPGLLFALLATLPFMEVMNGPRGLRRGDLARLVLWSVLAVWTSYATGLLFLAMGAAVLVRGSLEPAYVPALWRRLRELRPVGPGLLLLVGFGGLILYFAWTRRADPAGYLAEYLRLPGDGPMDLLVRGLNRILTMFTPWTFPDAAPLPPVIFLMAGLALSLGHLRRSDGRHGAAAIPLLLLLVIAALFAAAWFGRHPFGGLMRHQYLLLPFMILSALMVVGTALRRLRSPVTTLLGSVVLGLLAGWVAYRDHAGPRVDGFAEDVIWRQVYARIASGLREGDAIYLHEFSLIPFYANSREEGAWEFTATFVTPSGSPYDRFRATVGGHAVHVLRDRERWVPPTTPDAPFTAEIAAALTRERLERIWIVACQKLPQLLPTDRPAHMARMKEAYARHGLVLQEHFWIGVGEVYRLVR